jgi:hypothetical protein
MSSGAPVGILDGTPEPHGDRCWRMLRELPGQGSA